MARPTIESDLTYRATHKAQKNAYMKIYRANNKEKLAVKAKKYRDLHKEEHKEYLRKHYIHKPRKQKYYPLTSRGKIRKNLWQNKKKKEDIQFRLRNILSVRISSAIRNEQKSGSAVRDLGCSVPELRCYLEGKFTDGMSWENYGMHGWHIDHVFPLTYFDLTNREQFLKAVHYTNLQPLWAVDNIKKGNKILYPLR